MTTTARMLLAGTMATALALSGATIAGAQADAAPELAYRVTEGQNLNAFLRDGPVAAHLLLRNGTDPRILVAFPAGNSGVGLWFEPLAQPATWTLDQSPRAATAPGVKGPQPAIVTIASIAAPQLRIKQAVLSSVRFLRDYQSVGRFPAELAVDPMVNGDTIRWSRARLDGAPGYLLQLRVLSGRLAGRTIVATGGRPIRVEITASSGETPLTGLPLADLLNARAADDPVARNALRFLSYQEKFLAGSWRFQTYFGRDTLMSLRLLMPALQPRAIEAGLGSVLARLDAQGDVAHEEGIGEFAVVDRRRQGDRGDAAVLDYAMIDDDYMLAPVAATYLLDHADRAGADRFLSRTLTSEGIPGRTEPAGAALVRNLRFVMTQAAPFARSPAVERLIALKPGRLTGEWRDSEEGLGRGRYAYDVNAVFVPAALEAGARLLAAGLLDRYLTAADRAALAPADAHAQVWRDRAPPLFRVALPAATAAPRSAAYARTLGVPAAPALAALGRAPLVFHAISLDERGAPVPIVNSDEGFALLFADPSPADLATYVTAAMRPFPAGLMTDIGLLVANAAQADAAVQARFTPAAYHGTVVWSWQQALFAAGLERQLARTDLPAATRAVLTDAQTRLWRAIAATRATQSSELWSWAFADGRYKVVAFGAGKQDVDESNAAQLWSTVYLAVRPPARLDGRKAPATPTPERR
jgi:glycogen debranching enzyme